MNKKNKNNLAINKMTSFLAPMDALIQVLLLSVIQFPIGIFSVHFKASYN